MFEMYTLFFQNFPSDFATFQQHSYKIYQHARNVKYKITFFCPTPIALNIEAILPRYCTEIFSIFVNVSSAIVYMHTTMEQ